MIAFAARVYAWRFGLNVARVVGGCLFILLWSACTANRYMVIQGAMPGGLGMLHQQDGPELGGGGLVNGIPMPGSPGFIGPVLGSNILPPPPGPQWSVMVRAAQNAPCAFPGVAWLAAVAFYESTYGSNMSTTPTGNRGYGMFGEAMKARYGLTETGLYDFNVMLPAMVRKMCDDGIATDPLEAMFRYNGGRAYANHIAVLVQSWAGMVIGRWHDLPAFNQFDPRNWSNRENFNVWAAASCSAASLDWLLTAYGTPPGSIDAALALIGANTGISSRVGLLDHTGSALASALGRAGYSSWRAQVSRDELRARLRQGPAMLDGAGWFGVGHWFVATGSDDGGISIRESSGNNIQYLTWQRLYGEVGWTGWAVGINSQTPANQA